MAVMGGFLTRHLLALLAGFCLDLILGDPRWFPHPVRAMGGLIAALEGGLRRIFPARPRWELLAGGVLAAVLVILPGGLTWLVLRLCATASPWLAFGVESLVCYQLLATRALKAESGRVYQTLKRESLEGARRAVAMIVGRDTGEMDEAQVVRAAVESVAENTCDGVVAPLIFLAIGGAPLGMAYKAVSTMDSMLGYRNTRYLYFGRAAARLDDVLNFLPARLAGALMCLAAAACGYDAKGAWRIFRRDRNKHASPNSAHTEAACAGALELRLGGPACYGGKEVEKPWLGDGTRTPEPVDILRAQRLLYGTAFFTLALVCGLPLVFLLFP